MAIESLFLPIHFSCDKKMTGGNIEGIPQQAEAAER